MARLVAVVWLVSLVLCPRTADAVLGVGDLVWDPTNWVENNIAAIQTGITAANTAEIIANQVLELTALEEWAIEAEGWEQDLQQLQTLVSQADGLGWDLERLNNQVSRLFGLDTAPTNSRDFWDRQREIRGYLQQSWLYAMQTQTLVTSVLRTVNHILGIYGTVQGLVGNKQGQQSLAQYQAKLTQVLAEMNTHTAALHRAQSVQGINDPLIQQAIDNINEGVWSDWAQGDTGQ